MRVFKNRAEAEKAGFKSASPEPRPLMVYRFDPITEYTSRSVPAIVRTDLEVQLAEALEACLQEHGGFTIRGDCERNALTALKSFRGEPLSEQES